MKIKEFENIESYITHVRGNNSIDIKSVLPLQDGRILLTYKTVVHPVTDVDRIEVSG